MVNKIKSAFGIQEGLLSAKKEASTTQFFLTFLLVLALVTANLVTIKTVDILGLPWLANNAGVIVFPVVYILSDVIQEVWGYRWSRLTATYAFIGTFLVTAVIQLAIFIPGNAEWTAQEAMVAIMGQTPAIALGSLIAFFFGDWANDSVFQWLKKHYNGKFAFQVRAFGSSIVGAYVDSALFTLIGLYFLPWDVKLLMIINTPLVKLALEALVLPVTTAVMHKVKASEEALIN